MTDDTAEEIIGRLLGLHQRMRDHFAAVTAELGLTPAEGQALHRLADPQPMKAMADSMSCDASYITLIADRLEEQGLIDRVADPADRRVKQLVLTPRGRKTRNLLVERIHASSPALVGLGSDEAESLVALLRRLEAPAT